MQVDYRVPDFSCSEAFDHLAAVQRRGRDPPPFNGVRELRLIALRVRRLLSIKRQIVELCRRSLITSNVSLEDCRQARSNLDCVECALQQALVRRCDMSEFWRREQQWVADGLQLEYTSTITFGPDGYSIGSRNG
jgi:hypothetical protein